ncbi:unnamed protein product, partial [Effrenium voratum]
CAGAARRQPVRREARRGSRLEPNRRGAAHAWLRAGAGHGQSPGHQAGAGGTA